MMSSPRTSALRAEHCPICEEYPGVGAFCSACGVLTSHPTSGDYAAPYLRRLGCELLDLLIFLLLPIWLYWMWFSARDGQSPAKSLLDMYVIHESGQPITPRRMWVRELLIQAPPAWPGRLCDQPAGTDHQRRLDPVESRPSMHSRPHGGNARGDPTRGARTGRGPERAGARRRHHAAACAARAASEADPTRACALPVCGEAPGNRNRLSRSGLRQCRRNWRRWSGDKPTLSQTEYERRRRALIREWQDTRESARE